MNSADWHHCRHAGAKLSHVKRGVPIYRCPTCGYLAFEQEIPVADRTYSRLGVRDMVSTDERVEASERCTVIE